MHRVTSPCAVCLKVGMAGKLMENKQAAALFELASKVMGYDMVGLIAQGPQEKLDTTLYSQVALNCVLAVSSLALIAPHASVLKGGIF